MEWITPKPQQVKRLAAAIAAHDGRGDGKTSRASAERFHQAHIEQKVKLSGPEMDMLSDLIENTPDTYEEYPETMLLARHIADALSIGNIHLIFTVARCHQSIADIANHFGGDYKDYPVITIHDLFRDNLRPKNKWGVGRARLNDADYDRMAAILVALYLHRSMGLDGSCMLQIDLYSKVIEPLVVHNDVVRRNLTGMFALLREAERAFLTSKFGVYAQRLELDVHAVIRLTLMLDADERNLERALSFVRERRNLSLDGLEAFLTEDSAPALIGGGL